MKKYYGIYRLPHELLFKESCLGKEFEIEICGVKGLICFPRVVEAKHRNGEKPFLVCPFDDVLCRRLGDEQGYEQWGRVLSWPNYLAYVSQVVLVFENKTKDDLQVIFNNIDEWFKVSYNIITIKTGVSCYFSPVQIEAISPALNFYEVEKDEAKRLHMENENLTSMNLILHERGIENDEYKEILEISNHSGKITPEYSRYLEAIHSFDQGDYKSVVVNCSIAIEGAIVKEIRKVCAEKNLSSTKFFEKYKMLGGVFSLAECLKITLPTSDYRENINKIRNGVVHDGDEPSEKQANKFLQDTKLYLEKFCEMVE